MHAALESAPIAWDAAITRPWRLPLKAPAGITAPCVAIWRNPGAPIECGLLAIEIVRDALGILDPDRVKVRREEAEGPRLSERTRLAAVRATRERRHERVLATCSKCGRDLRDPVYAQIGIGPECIKAYPAAEVRLRRRLNQAVDARRPTHLNAKKPSDWAVDVATHWHLGTK